MDVATTILAIASPPGRSPRGIIRISGDRTLDLLEPHLTGSETPPPEHELTKATLRGLLPADLPVLACFFRGPRSFTGQDSFELQMPGNPLLLERVIDALLEFARRHSIEARRAQPGEFTARAFFLGKLSLTEAEGVAAIIGAQSDAELRAARILRSGALGNFAHQIADRLAHLLALVEAGIDFTDQEDVVPIPASELRDRLGDLRGELLQQLDRSVGAEQLEAIPWVVLAGPPNAGKSTLFNALLGRERAVISAGAGTTRDVLAEPLAVETEHGRAELMLVDLAGADEATDPLNRRMQAAADSARGRAELVLWCAPVGSPPPAAVPEPALLVRTKADTMQEGDDATGDVIVSAHRPETLDALRSMLPARLSNRAVSLASDLMALQPRHEAALRAALEHLAAAIESLPAGSGHHVPAAEITAASMRAALDELSALAGDITPDDILGRVFSTFCVGK